MRYWHQNIWRDNEVVCLHYIVDKPWASRISESGTAGFKGKDGVTHSWWWDGYEAWADERKRNGDDELLELVAKHVAKEDSADNSDPDMKAIGSGVQAFANNKSPEEAQSDEGADEKAAKHENVAPGGPVLRKKMLGERGHGPVVRPNVNGSSMMPP